MEMSDLIGWKAEWTIYKWRDPDGRWAKMLKAGASIKEVLAAGAEFIAVEKFKGNVALNEGLQHLIEIICGIGVTTKWDAANARIGVGDSNAAENATQTGLQAATNKFWQAMDGTYPQRSGQIAEWRATFADGDAEFAWEEFTVVNSTDDTDENLNRKVVSKGTKGSGEAWTASVKITFS